MKVLGVHPGPLMYTKIFLRLEPLGLELVAAAVRAGRPRGPADRSASREPPRLFRLVDELAAGRHRVFLQLPRQHPRDRRPREGRQRAAAEHARSASAGIARRLSPAPSSSTATARSIASCAAKARPAVPMLLAAIEAGGDLARVPGTVTAAGEGPPPGFVHSLDELLPARDLLRHRRKYFLGVLDPCASIEFSRGCPWDCSFCSAWTFYGRSYRLVSPERVDRGPARGSASPASSSSTTSRSFTTSTACDRARRSPAPASRSSITWRRAATCCCATRRCSASGSSSASPTCSSGSKRSTRRGCKKYRKRVPLGRNFEALEFARSLGIQLAINLIADPDWDRDRFRGAARVVPRTVPEIINISVNTPYPGTESWLTEQRRLTTRDYRLFDIQHAVLPTRLPLRRILRGAGDDAAGIYAKHIDWRDIQGRGRHRHSALAARPDQFREKPVQAEQRLPHRPAACRPRPAGRLRNPAAAAAAPRAATRCRPFALRACTSRPRRPRDRRRHRALRRRNPHGRLAVGCLHTRHPSEGRDTIIGAILG